MPQYDADLHLIGDQFAAAKEKSQHHWEQLTSLAAGIEREWSHDWHDGPPPKDNQPYVVWAPPHGELTVKWDGYWVQADGGLVRTGLMVPIIPIKWRSP